LSCVFDDAGYIEEGVKNDVGGRHEIAVGGTMIYINHVKVKEDFRGLGLGLYMVDEACRKINGRMSLTILRPAPISSSGLAPKERKRAIRKLRAYYGLLDFRALGEDYIARWNGYESASLQTVCPHLF